MRPLGKIEEPVVFLSLISVANIPNLAAALLI